MMMGHVWFVQASSTLLPSAMSGARSVRVRRGPRRKRAKKTVGGRGRCMVGLMVLFGARGGSGTGV